MRVVVLGGTGFIGSQLCAELIRDGHEVLAPSRRPENVSKRLGPDVRGLPFDGSTASGWGQVVNSDTAIVNLAGESIAERWTPAKRKRILDSRINAGRAVMDAVKNAPDKPLMLVQGSAVGFYGPQGPDPVDETFGPGSGFLADVCVQWEASSQEVEKLGVPRAVVRTGVVLGPGGALRQMTPSFKFYLGGPVGSGRQGVSWIHRDDETGAIRFLLANHNQGVFNLTAPEPVHFKAFARALGKAMGRPSWLPAPGFALKLLFGAMAEEVLLSGQFALPANLLRAGYRFRRIDLAGALSKALGNR